MLRYISKMLLFDALQKIADGLLNGLCIVLLRHVTHLQFRNAPIQIDSLSIKSQSNRVQLRSWLQFVEAKCMTGRVHLSSTHCAHLQAKLHV